jgi:uncharacterized membrane protein YjjP (DUF1212 family)
VNAREWERRAYVRLFVTVTSSACGVAALVYGGLTDRWIIFVWGLIVFVVGDFVLLTGRWMGR